MRLFHLDKALEEARSNLCDGYVYPPEEIKINTKQLYTINIHNGDEIIIDPKN